MTTVDISARRGRSEKKRLAILDAARRLFVQDGYELTSVDAIAARAGVSKRTVYDHFGDKERIHSAVLEQVTELMMSRLAELGGVDRVREDGVEEPEADDAMPATIPVTTVVSRAVGT